MTENKYDRKMQAVKPPKQGLRKKVRRFYYDPIKTATWSSDGNPYNTTMFQAAVLHYFVAAAIDTEPDDGHIALPEDTVRNECGSSADQAVLLASLLETESDETRVIRLKNGEGECRHVVEFRSYLWMEDDLTNLRRDLEKIHRDILPAPFASTAVFGFEPDDETPFPYFIVDPVAGKFIGDIRGLESEGWVETRGNKWRWSEPVSYKETEVWLYKDDCPQMATDVAKKVVLGLAKLAPDFEYDASNVHVPPYKDRGYTR